MYLISLYMEDNIPYIDITISSFVAIRPHLTKLFYNIGQLTHLQTFTYRVITVILPIVARLNFIFLVAYMEGIRHFYGSK